MGLIASRDLPDPRRHLVKSGVIRKVFLRFEHKHITGWWVVPPPSNSHHQDYYILVGDPYKHSFATVTGRGDNPNRVVVSNIFSFHPYLGKIPILTNIFSKGLKPPTSISTAGCVICFWWVGGGAVFDLWSSTLLLVVIQHKTLLRMS